MLLVQRHAKELWLGAAGFAISMLELLCVGRTFNNYCPLWPMTGAAAAALIASGIGRTRATRT